MARKTKELKSKPKRPGLKRGEATEATVDEFEREGMGIASKE
jgi:predicted RNA-binding protein with TRAM domain